MATRLYFSNIEAPAGLEPAFCDETPNGVYWMNTDTALRRRLLPVKSNTAFEQHEVTKKQYENYGGEWQLFRQYITPPLAAPVTLDGTVKAQLRAMQHIYDGPCIWEDDFTGNDGDQPNSARWWPEVGTTSIQNNKLEMSVEGTNPGEQVTLRYVMYYDFDIQVDFEVMTGPDTNGWEAELFVRKSSDYWSMTMRRGYGASGGMYRRGYKNNSASWTWTTDTGISDTTGKFRITRVGSTWHTYYWLAGAWHEIGTGQNMGTGAVYVYLIMSNSGSNPDATVRFDNFLLPGCCPNRDADCEESMVIMVVNQDGTVRKEIPFYSEIEVGSFEADVLTNRSYCLGGGGSMWGEVEAQVGDRIIVEIGSFVGCMSDPNFGLGCHQDVDTIEFGDAAASDLPENNTETAQYNPWIEFSQDLTFGPEPEPPVKTPGPGVKVRSDNFNRPDVNPAGDPWSTMPGQGAHEIKDEKLKTTAAGWNVSYYNADTFQEDQYSQVTVLTAGVGPAVRIDPDTGTGIIVTVNGTYDGYKIYKNAGAGWIEVDDIEAALAAGDKIRLVADGDTIKVYVNGKKKSQTEGSDVPGGGNPGTGGEDPGGEIDDWQGGDLIMPSKYHYFYKQEGMKHG